MDDAVTFITFPFYINVTDKDLVNPAKKSERLVTCVGKLKEAKKGKKMLLDMPYRLVFAVGTNDSCKFNFIKL